MRKQLAIIGAGSAALLLAAFLDPAKFEVTIYEKNKAAGRKFLVAGKGGFNLTHSEDMPTLVKRYTPDSFLAKALLEFTNMDLRQWLESIGVPTFVGSSKRVYPVAGVKPIEVLKRMLSVLEERGVQIHYEHEWLGWSANGDLTFAKANETKVQVVQTDYTVFALGGASWKVTGSDGSWQNIFSEKGILTKEFRGVNCAYQVDWPPEFINQYEGQPLKNMVIECDGKRQKGEVVITKFGLEGNALYGLSPQIEKAFHNNVFAKIHLDVKPMFSSVEIQQKLAQSKEKKRSEILRKTLKINKVQLALLKITTSKEEFESDWESLALKIKAIPVAIKSSAPMDEAISTIGGISREELTPNFELKKRPHTFCIGEMVDWNAPTGGYLLQGCFSMGAYVARHLNKEVSGNMFIA